MGTQPNFTWPFLLGPFSFSPFSPNPFSFSPLLGAFKPEDSREVRESRSLGVWPLLKGIEQFETLNHKCRTGWTGWDSQKSAPQKIPKTNWEKLAWRKKK